METELCRIHYQVNMDGMAKRSFFARGSGVKTVKKVSFSKKGIGSIGKHQVTRTCLAMVEREGKRDRGFSGQNSAREQHL